MAKFVYGEPVPAMILEAGMLYTVAVPLRPTCPTVLQECGCERRCFERRGERKTCADKAHLVSASSARAASPGRGGFWDGARWRVLAECGPVFPLALLA